MSLLSLILPLAAGIALAVPDTVPARGAAAPATVIVHRQPGLPLVALRLSVLADDPAGYAGVGHLIQHLHEAALRERVDRVGGRVAIERNTDALVYTLTGPARELDHLAAAARSVLDAPRASEAEFTLARQALARERLAEWETAAGHTRAALRAGLFPADLPAAGTEASAERWERARLAELWAAMYRPDRVSIVAVGDVEARAVERAFAQLPAAAGRAAAVLRDSAAPLPVAAPEATLGWLGQGYTAADADAAVVTVAARLLQEQLRERVPGGRASAEHWWTHQGQAVALIVAAPEPQLPAARRALGGAVAALQADLRPERVRAAAAAVRREMLFYARTPAQMAELLGRFADRDGRTDAAERFFLALDLVDETRVAELLGQLAVRTPVRVDIPPQQLPRRS